MNGLGYSQDVWGRWKCDKCGIATNLSAMRLHVQTRHLRDIKERRFLEPAEIREREAKRSLERAEKAAKHQADDLLAIVRDLSVTPPS